MDTEYSSKSTNDYLSSVISGKICTWDKEITGTALEKFKNSINKKYSTKLKNYTDLHKWTIENCEQFWEEMWIFAEIISSHPYSEVLEKGDNIFDAKWFTGAKMNFAENLLRFKDNHVALLCVDEKGNAEHITYSKLWEETGLYAAALRKHKLKLGDKVVCIMKNIKEACFVMLATISIGGVFCGIPAQYGNEKATSFVKNMEPRFLFATDRHWTYNIEHNQLKKVHCIVQKLKSIQKVIIVRTKKDDFPDISEIQNACYLEEFLQSGKNSDGSVPELIFEQLPPYVPITINLTSGTTGEPKCVLHAAACIVSLMKDSLLSLDCTRKDVILNTHTPGWINWFNRLSYLALGATILVFNGFPSPCDNKRTCFWDLISKYRVSIINLRPSNIIHLEMDSPAHHGGDYNLESLRVITIGGSTVTMKSFNDIMQMVGKDTYIITRYACTEICGLLNGIDFNLKVYNCQIPVPALGIDLRCVDDNGREITGLGELVIANPLPSMMIGTLKNGEMCSCHHLSKHNGMYILNDVAKIDPATNGLIITGRNDDLFNCNGMRFASSEIYAAISSIEEIEDNLCVAQYSSHGMHRAVLFVKMKNGYTFTRNLIKKIKNHIEKELSKCCVPEVVLEAHDIPYNFKGKRMEHLVKNIIANNLIPKDANVRNAKCLPSFCNIQELQTY